MSLIFAIWWVVLIELLAVFSFAFLFWVLPKFADRGWGLSKIFGVLIFSYLIWILVSVKLISFTFIWTLVVFLVLAAVSAAIFYFKRKEFGKFFSANKKIIFRTELLFLGAFAVFALIRSFNPEIFWGEKPMDFTILNSLLRSEHFPPYEAWLTGFPLNYYYFGTFVVAAITKLSFVSSAFTYNFGLATTQALLFIGVFSLIFNITKKFSWGLLAGLATAFLGNFESIALLVRGRPLDFGFFWDTTRVIPSGIEEYPLWSFLFGDLHAHYLALPYLILPVAYLYGIYQEFPKVVSKAQIGLYFLLSLSLGVMFITNSWNWPTLALISILFIIALAMSASFERKLYQPIKNVLPFVLGVIAVGASLLFVLPFFFAAVQKSQGSGWEENNATNLWQLVSVWGLFLIPIVFYLGYEFYAKFLRKLKKSGIFTVLLIILALVFLAVNSFIPLIKQLQNPVTAIFSFLGLLSLISWIASILRKEKGILLAKTILLATFVALIFSQVYFFADKMNTIFKIYAQAWIWLALSGSILIYSIWPNVKKFPKWGKLTIYIFGFAILTGATLTFATDILINSTTSHVPAEIKKLNRPTLDGMAYLKIKDPDEAKAIEFLRKIKGAPVILEAQKMSYGDYMRISMNTGLPIIVGWDHHLKQRGNPEAEIEARKVIVKEMYETKDTGRLKDLLKQYNVQYIYLGKLEKETYPTCACNFSSVADVVFESGEEKVLKVSSFE